MPVKPYVPYFFVSAADLATRSKYGWIDEVAPFASCMPGIAALSWGRFLSTDPINSAELGVPQKWNKYTYALDNPMGFTDPNGENPVVVVLLGVHEEEAPTSIVESRSETMNSTHHKPATERPLAKLVIELSRDDSPFASESLWAEKLHDDRYRLLNSPFAAYGYSYGDIVSAKPKGGQLIVGPVLIPGGHSTYRVFLASGLHPEHGMFIDAWRPLGELGCAFEGANDRLLAIDVPPTADIYQVYAFLESGEGTGVWEFEEAHLGHALSERDS